MSLKARLYRIERSNKSTTLLAFFFIPRELSAKEQSSLERELWSHYIAGGGDSKAQPAYLLGGRKDVGFIGCTSLERIVSKIMNQTKNPAEA